MGAHRIDTEGFQHRPPSGKDIFTFCYTSGTTGDRKFQTLLQVPIRFLSFIIVSIHSLYHRFRLRHLLLFI